MKLFGALLLGLSLGFAGNALAKPSTPTDVKGMKLVSPAEAKKLIDSGAQAVDVRKKLEFAEEHIPGAISVPYKEKSAKKPDFDSGKDKFKDKKVPKDKPVVIYCNGEKCWKSFKASKWLVDKGFTNINWLRHGIPGWKKAGFPTEK